MAIKSTIFKTRLSIADVDRAYYQDHELRLAQHPSETLERMMVRLLAFAMYADETLSFGGGLSSADEPDLWARDLTGEIKRWISVGLPDERVLRRACGRADHVVLITYGRNAALWWQQQQAALARLDRLDVIELPADATSELSLLVARTMQLQAHASDGIWWLGDSARSVQIEPNRRQTAQDR